MCTLPFGTCKHSEEWVRENYNTKEFKLMLSDNPLLQTTKSKADQEIDDVMNLISVSELTYSLTHSPTHSPTHSLRFRS